MISPILTLGIQAPRSLSPSGERAGVRGPLFFCGKVLTEQLPKSAVPQISKPANARYFDAVPFFKNTPQYLN
jgi:hypothetical protein